METKTETKKDVYSIATDHVISYMERGVVPWLVPWTDAGIPQNLITRKEFRGINVFLLAAVNYSKNFFVSPKQLQEIGGTLKESEKGNVIFYWKWPEQNGEQKTETNKEAPLLRYYYAYNISQCNGIKKGRIPKLEKPKSPLEMCVAIVGNMPDCPAITNGEHPATYMPTFDCLDIPKKEDFPNDESYYCTLFRALVHSTGHEDRLNRKEVMEATLTDHALHSTEALIGDLGASYLSSFAGIRFGLEMDVVAYCTNWIEKFKKDKRLIVYASTQAQRAVDFILNRKKAEQ